MVPILKHKSEASSGLGEMILKMESVFEHQGQKVGRLRTDNAIELLSRSFYE